MSKFTFEEKIKKSASSLPQNEAIRNFKKAFKSLQRKEIMALLDGKTLLDNSKIEKGTVYVKDLFTIDNYSFSILELCQDSKIAWHIHEKEIEYYIIWRQSDPKPCLIGKGHELENTREFSKFMLSVKIKE